MKERIQIELVNGPYDGLTHRIPVGTPCPAKLAMPGRLHRWRLYWYDVYQVGSFTKGYFKGEVTREKKK